ncbi:MAG: cytochrome c [Verrucomicrobia bacterium]|nr:cytochrome c [Deltaproteobacteria bacterium]
MLRAFPALCFIVTFAASLLAGCAKEAPQKTETGQVAVAVPVATKSSDMLRSGEALFKQYCSSCHPDGGNVSDPRRPLYGSALKRNHITKPEDIVKIMRNPLSRMIRFDVSTLSDKDARIIAEYILATFK